jgi:hypothetical protein
MFVRRDCTRASLAYRYHHPGWDSACNAKEYGALHGEIGVGGNMTVWLEVEAPLDDHNCLIVFEKSLDLYLQKAKLLLDHRCLFEAEPWFKDRPATPEIIAFFLREKIFCQRAPRGRWSRLVLEENSQFLFAIAAEGDEMLMTYRFDWESIKIAVTLTGLVSSAGLLINRTELLEGIAAWQKIGSVSLHPDQLFEALVSRFAGLKSLEFVQPNGSSLLLTV